MTDETAAAIRDAIAGNDALRRSGGGDLEATVTTTAFDATVAAKPAGGTDDGDSDDVPPDSDADAADEGVVFTATVEMPTLRAAVSGAEVGSALRDGWLETIERRLADAPKATRASVDLRRFDVESTDGRVVVTYEFTFEDPRRGIDVAKTFVEYVEGTYVQGIVPGFEYDPPVSELLDDAAHSGDGPGGTPL